MSFTDIHIHALSGVDDGARDEKTMFAMADSAYHDGVRDLCLTPHFHPGYFGDNQNPSQQVFETLCRYAEKKYPELRLYLGNELRFSSNCIAWLADGYCRTLNGTDYVLVDFYAGESARNISRGLEQLLSAGYVPVLAHAERYSELNQVTVREFVHNGVKIQLNAGSVLGSFGFGAKVRATGLLRAQLADLVASDAHDLHRRKPGLSAVHRLIEKKCGKAYADALCKQNALALLRDRGEEGIVTHHESL